MNSAGPHGDSGRDPAGTPGQERGLDLAPFRGVRYVPERVGSLAAVTSPPYDVVVRPDGLHHLESADPYNIVRLILPQAAGGRTDTEQAADTLGRWLAEGVLAADPRPAFYVYEQLAQDGLLQRGVIGALRLSEPAEGVVLPHEDVMPGIVAERADLMRATSANLEPLLLTYRAPDGGGTAAVVERTARKAPLLATVTEDGVRHRLWAVTEPGTIAEVRADLTRRQALIADGHHRWATYLRLRAEQPARRDGRGPWDFGLVLLVDTVRYPLRVRAIHRLLHLLPLPAATAAAADHFRVRVVDGPLENALRALAAAHAGSNAFLLAGADSAAAPAFHLVDRPAPGLLDRLVPADRPEAWRTLDATVLHAVLLDHVWKIPDTPEQIAYIHDSAAAVTKAVQDGSTAVLMHPVHEDVVRDLAGQGVMMPRKSTSFGPKPATGLVLRRVGGMADPDQDPDQDSDGSEGGEGG